MNQESQYQSLIAKFGIASFLMSLNLNPAEVYYLLGAIFADGVLGALASWRLGEEVTGKRFIWGMVGKFAILIIPFMLALFALSFGQDISWIINGFVYVIAANESVAIMAKTATIRTGKRFKNKDFIGSAIDAVSKFFETKVNAIFEALKK